MKGHDLAAFLADRILLRATARGIEITGEAASGVSTAYTAAHGKISGNEAIDSGP